MPKFALPKLVRAPVFEDRELTRVAAVLTPCVWAAIVGGLAFMLFVVPGSATWRLDTPIMGGVFAMSALVLRLVHTGRVHVASVVFIATVCGAIVTGAVATRRYDHETNYVLAIMITGVLVGGRGAFAVAVVVLAGELISIWVHDATPDRAHTSLMVINLLVTAAFMTIAHRSVRNALAEAKRYADALEDKATDLELASSQLQDEIDQHRGTQAALEIACDRAVQASEFKTRFLATMSHEIRTPMSAISGMTDLLREMELDPQSAEFVEMIRVSADSLLVIINDILDISRIESGQFELESQPLVPSACARAATDLVAVQAAGKGLDMTAHIDPSVPAAILGDPTRLKQILINLLGNAVKFTHRGEVTLRVDADPIATDAHPPDPVRAPEGATHWLRIQVEDTGVGIPARFRERLFDAFSQADPATAREYGGSGLGLTITKQLVARMGGAIRVDSEVGRGSTFHVDIPVCEATGIRPAARAADPLVLDRSLAEALPFAILVAEDNPVNRKLAIHLLTRLGYRPDIAETGTRAVDAAQQRHYDVIFMDVQMPEMDGLEATRRIRAARADDADADDPADDPADDRPPYIVGLTAGALPGDRERCLAAGMDEHISKPFKPAQLIAALQRAAGSRR